MYPQHPTRNPALQAFRVWKKYGKGYNDPQISILPHRDLSNFSIPIPSKMGAINKLRASDIKKLPDGRHSDGQGLYLFVKGSARSWVYRYKIGGKLKDVGLGSAYSIPLSAARGLAADLRQKVRSGEDIVTPKRATMQKVRERLAIFSEVVPQCIENQRRVRQWRTESQALRWTRTIRKYAMASLGDKPISSITRDDILAILQPIWLDRTETAANLQRYLSAVFVYALSQGMMQGENPAKWQGNLDQFLPAPSKIMLVDHHAALNWQEVPDLFENLNGRLSVVSKAIMFCVLTAARANEFCLAQWSEIDFKNGVWICPRRKDGRPEPHRVPLSPQVLKWLKTFPHVNEYIFFGYRMRGHIALDSPIKMLHMLKPGFTIHGMRSTFRDWAAEHGYDRVLAEKALQHQTGNEVEQAYQRSDLLEQRRPMMTAWAEFCFSKIKKSPTKRSA